MAFGFGFGFTRNYVAALFSPASLFANGEQGAWYDPSDLMTLFQDSAGTTPVTAVQQPVGLMLDKSGRGNHAFQTTSASRPVLSARYNLLTRTEELGTSPWTNVQGVSTYVDNKIIPAATTSIHGRRQNYATVSGRAVVASAKVKAGDVGVNLEFWTYVDDGAVINPTTWAVTSATGCTVTLGEFDFDGYRWVYFAFTEDATGANNLDFRVTRSTARNQQFVGDGVAGVYVKSASIVSANEASIPYQRVNTATDYDTVGFKPYLAFDGVDDSLVTNSIDFTATDKMTVFAGVRKLSDAADGVLVELSASVTDNNGSFAVLAPYASTTNRMGFGLRGTQRTNQVTGTADYVAPITMAVTTSFDISQATSATEILPRINGVVPTTTSAGATASGTGNFGNYPLNIGRRNNATVPFNGRLYSLIVRGAASTTAQITSTETYVNQKTGAYT